MKVAACVVAAVALVAAFGCAPAAGQNLTDADILNFALNLEYLEAEFYSWAVNGKGLPSSLRGSGGCKSTGGEKANLTGNVLAYATEIAKDEENHVRFLRSALGDNAVSMPCLDIGPAFASAAEAAFNMSLSPSFSPYANDLFFMHGAFIFEDVGVTAYKGAAALITTPDYLTAAAGILAVEAYHAGTVRSYLADNANVSTPYDVNVSTIVGAIAALRSTLSGLPMDTPDDYGIYNATSGNITVVPTDVNGIVYSRTPAQVVSIVTFGSANGTGGFFPDGLKGTINATLASGEEVAVGDSTPSGSMTPSQAAMAPSSEPAMAPGSMSPASAPGGSSTPTAAPSSATTTSTAAALAVASLVGAASLLLA